MLFNSVSFLIFFPIVAMGYFVVPEKLKNLWLLIASYYFYMSWNAVYALLILFSTVTTYLCGLLIGNKRNSSRKKLFLTINIIINIAVLFYFKYFGFFIDVITDIFPGLTVARTGTMLAVVGISFYTFQSLGYTIDVYRGTVKAERNFLTYALFVSFFPQLVAGPIERSGNLLPQFKESHKFSYERVTDGLVLMAWGFFKKMVVADGAAAIVSTVYGNVTKFGPSQLLLATVLFAFVIYGDFSGYSDIAIGAANVMGFKLMRNFYHPYFSKNISEFWRRWHISLSGWFTDYIYIPLGGSRKGELRTYINLLIVFFVSGLWHGAAYTFVVWGLLNGLYSIFYRLYRKVKGAKKEGENTQKSASAFKNAVSAFITFVAVDFSWIFFRADNLKDAVFVSGRILQGLLAPLKLIPTQAALTSMGFFTNNGYAIIACIVFMLAVEAWEGKGALVNKINRLNPVLRWAFYYCVISLIMLFGSFGQSRFIYFRF